MTPQANDFVNIWVQGRNINLFTVRNIELLIKERLQELSPKTSHLYSQVPIKRVGPNKRVGWIF